jgi:hypothetical protein
MVIMDLSHVVLANGLIGRTKYTSHFSNDCKVTCKFSGISSLRHSLSTLTSVVALEIFLRVLMEGRPP